MLILNHVTYFLVNAPYIRPCCTCGIETIQFVWSGLPAEWIMLRKGPSIMQEGRNLPFPPTITSLYTIIRLSQHKKILFTVCVNILPKWGKEKGILTEIYHISLDNMHEIFSFFLLHSLESRMLCRVGGRVYSTRLSLSPSPCQVGTAQYVSLGFSLVSIPTRQTISQAEVYWSS